jgi:hypothetical protein
MPEERRSSLDEIEPVDASLEPRGGTGRCHAEIESVGNTCFEKRKAISNWWNLRKVLLRLPTILAS